MDECKQALRAVIADDEELARSYLKELLEQHPDIQIVAECRNGFEAVNACLELEPELIFLDIRMPGLDGFEVVELLEPEVRVIFITAYDKYALRAFEVNAVDYLLKPFSEERLADAITRVARGPRSTRGNFDVGEMARTARQGEQTLSRIVVRDGSRIVFIAPAELDCARAEGDYVSLYTGKMSYLKHQTISSLEKSLDASRFARVHRSAIVRLSCIDHLEAVSKDTKVAILKNGERIPVSKSGLKRLKELLKDI